MTHARLPSPQPPIQVIAHRGASDDAPEHTLAAYRKAIEDGADALECDVRLTADGQLVCVHDRRVNRTSNGRGAVSALELADLATLDFGSWKKHEGHAGPDESPDWGRAASSPPYSPWSGSWSWSPTSASGRRVQLAIETKHPTRWAGQVEERLLQLLKRFGLDTPPADGPSPVRVMSFSARSLHRVRAAAPHPADRLSDAVRLARDTATDACPAGVRIAGPGMRIVRSHPGYVERLHTARDTGCTCGP